MDPLDEALKRVPPEAKVAGLWMAARNSIPCMGPMQSIQLSSILEAARELVRQEPDPIVR